MNQLKKKKKHFSCLTNRLISVLLLHWAVPQLCLYIVIVCVCSTQVLVVGSIFSILHQTCSHLDQAVAEL